MTVLLPSLNLFYYQSFGIFLKWILMSSSFHLSLFVFCQFWRRSYKNQLSFSGRDSTADFFVFGHLDQKSKYVIRPICNEPDNSFGIGWWILGARSFPNVLMFVCFNPPLSPKSLLDLPVLPPYGSFHTPRCVWYRITPWKPLKLVSLHFAGNLSWRSTSFSGSGLPCSSVRVTWTSSWFKCTSMVSSFLVGLFGLK